MGKTRLSQKQRNMQLALLDEYKKRQTFEKRILEGMNEKFIPFLHNTCRYLVFMGGGGSGKSIFAGQKQLYRIKKESDPKQIHRILAIRKVAKTIRQSVWAQLKQQRLEFDDNLDNWYKNESDMILRYIPNGNEIICVGLDKQHCSV